MDFQIRLRIFFVARSSENNDTAQEAAHAVVASHSTLPFYEWQESDYFYTICAIWEANLSICL